MTFHTTAPRDCPDSRFLPTLGGSDADVANLLRDAAHHGLVRHYRQLQVEFEAYHRVSGHALKRSAKAAPSQGNSAFTYSCVDLASHELGMQPHPSARADLSRGDRFAPRRTHRPKEIPNSTIVME